MGNIVLFGIFALIGAAVYKVREEGDSGAMVYVLITLLLVV
jgi:hypothetical protein